MRLADAPDVLKVDEVAELVRADRKTIYEAINEGSLRAVRLGRALRVPKQHLIAWLGLESDEDTPRAHLTVVDGGAGDG